MQNWRDWLARWLGIQSHVDREEKESWFRMGMAYATKKPVHRSFSDYPAILQREADAAQRMHGTETPTLDALKASNDEFTRRNQRYAANLHTQHMSIPRSPLRRHALTPMPPVDDGWLNDQRRSNAS